MDEFGIIAKYFAPLAADSALGLRDDAATLTVPAGKELVLTKDAIVAGTHFFPDDAPADIAHKLLRVNLSDLAAKGATPLGYMLALMLPADTNEAWIAAFAKALAKDQQQHQLSLLGGDTTRTSGPLCLSLTAFGTVDKDTMLTRSGAMPGDTLYMTGTVGDAALYLAHRQHPLPLNGSMVNQLHDRYLRPQPRHMVGPALIGIASACMDVSDGLVGDCEHLTQASNVAITIDSDKLPLSPAAQAALAHQPDLLETILTGGDDYELLFTAPKHHADSIATIAATQHITIQPIGAVCAGTGVKVLDNSNSPIDLSKKSWRHF